MPNETHMANGIHYNADVCPASYLTFCSKIIADLVVSDI